MPGPGKAQTLGLVWDLIGPFLVQAWAWPWFGLALLGPCSGPAWALPGPCLGLAWALAMAVALPGPCLGPGLAMPGPCLDLARLIK